MKGSTIHHLNSGIIILSTIVAYLVPFEMFLLAYAVLGPLHYLTEIGWLHKKNYFTKGKYDFIILGVICTIMVFLNFNPPKNGYMILADLLAFALLISFALVYIKDWLYRIAVFVLAIFTIAFLNNAPSYFIWVAILLPTIIHVFIFTFLFMFYGVLKEKSWPGLISIAVLILCTATFFIYQPETITYHVSDYVQRSYSVFKELNFRLIQLFNLGQLNNVNEVFTTHAGFVIMRFIAFAYTYHYLNWFSKTSVIKWHQVSKRSLIITIAVWLISVALYAFEYNIGLKVLLYLSFLHVFLEFPLNVVSFTGIGKELKSLTKGS